MPAELAVPDNAAPVPPMHHEFTVVYMPAEYAVPDLTPPVPPEHYKVHMAGPGALEAK